MYHKLLPMRSWSILYCRETVFNFKYLIQGNNNNNNNNNNSQQVWREFFTS
jgi:hypothetical protein